MQLPSINQLSISEGTRVLVRVDFNEPVKDGRVQDDYRIQQSMQTITALRDMGARVILMSHFKGTDDNSLKPVADYINDRICSVRFVPECVGPEAAEAVAQMEPSDVLLLENLRKHKEEKGNDEQFAKQLAEHADVYVNEAFSVSHRRHASMVTVPRHLSAAAGFRVIDEVNHLSEAFEPPHPFMFILGGAKFETKIPLIRKFVRKADTVFVGGALANDLFQAKGLAVGKSLVSDADFDFEKLLSFDNLVLPSDVITDHHRTVSPDEVGDNEKIMDAGPQTVDTLRRSLKNAALTVWNGPLGDYEHGFKDGTLGLAKAIGNAPTESIVGGGDTLASIEELSILNSYTFVSTGGGAMLDFLANEDLPALKVLRQQ